MKEKVEVEIDVRLMKKIRDRVEYENARQVMNQSLSKENELRYWHEDKPHTVSREINWIIRSYFAQLEEQSREQ